MKKLRGLGDDFWRGLGATVVLPGIGVLYVLAAVVGLVVCLAAAELLDAHWLYLPSLALFFVALLATEVAIWGLRGFTVLIACMGGVIATAFLVQRIS